MAGTGRSPRRERIVGAAILATMLGLFAYALFIFVLPFAFPTPPPIITRFQSTVVFSPNDDGRRDVARINVRVNEPGEVLLDIVSGGDTVATLTGEGRRPRGWVRVSWDGRDDRGEVVPDGEYGVRLRARSGDKRFNTSRKIRVDTTAPGIARLRVVSATLAGPGRGECRVTATAADPGSLLLEALRPGGTAVQAQRGPSPAAPGRPARWRWDGLHDAGRPVAVGLYLIRATLSDPAGNRAVRRATCWVGRIAGATRPIGPSPRAPLAVTLRSTTGAPLDADTPVRLEFRRRQATPGAGEGAPLGPRVGARYRGRLDRARIVPPAGVDRSGLWLVARTPEGTALIPLGGTP